MQYKLSLKSHGRAVQVQLHGSKVWCQVRKEHKLFLQVCSILDLYEKRSVCSHIGRNNTTKANTTESIESRFELSRCIVRVSSIGAS